MVRNGATYYYARELPGHVSGLIDSGNQLVNQYRYFPFGQVEYQSEQVVNPLRFQGREIDAETQLYYFRNRWYDPELALRMRVSRTTARGAPPG